MYRPRSLEAQVLSTSAVHELVLPREYLFLPVDLYPPGLDLAFASVHKQHLRAEDRRSVDHPRALADSCAKECLKGRLQAIDEYVDRSCVSCPGLRASLLAYL